jgi:hypothetical protein
METLSHSVYALLEKALKEDFSEALSTQIILENTRKCFIDFNSCENLDYIRLIDAIIDDYEMINPLGNNNFFLIKKELRSAL